MSQNNQTEIVINSSLVNETNEAQFYEFVLDEELTITECGFVESLSQGVVSPMENIAGQLQGLLFELNHVRVNPKLDNHIILDRLALALETSGVQICNPPTADLMAMCFKPLGELSDIVRFYVTYNNQIVFLSSSVKLRCVK